MMVLGVDTLDIIFTFLFLVPGFLTFIIAKYLGKITSGFDKFDKTIYTLIASGSAISIFVGGHIMIYGQAPPTEITEDLLWEAAAAYFALIAIASVQGGLIGLGIDYIIFSDQDIYRDPVWTLIFADIEEPAEVRVVTQNGHELHGYVDLYDFPHQSKDIFLRFPQLILREDGSIVKKVSIGNSLYIGENSISHIYFEGEVNIDENSEQNLLQVARRSLSPQRDI